MNKIAIEARRVIKIKNKNDWKLRNVDLRLYFGDSVAIIGPRNSGKETLARLLAGEIRPTFGNIYYGLDIIKNGDISLQFRQTLWPFGFIVKDIINLYINIFKIDDEQWINKLYDIFKIKDFINEKLDKLDLIWAQIFNIFLAFLSKPKIIVIDTIPASIGVFMRKNIVSFIKEYKDNNEVCIVIISPDVELFSQICNKVILMYKGTIVKVDELKSNPTPELYHAYLDNITDLVKNSVDDKVQDDRLKIYLSKIKELNTIYNTNYEKYISKYFDSKRITANKNIFLNINKWKAYYEILYKILYLIGNNINTKANVKNFLKNIKEFEMLYNKTLNNFNKLTSESNDISNFMKISEDLKFFFDNDVSQIKIIINDIEKNLSKNDKELEKYKRKIINEEQKILKRIK